MVFITIPINFTTCIYEVWQLNSRNLVITVVLATLGLYEADVWNNGSLPQFQ